MKVFEKVNVNVYLRGGGAGCLSVETDQDSPTIILQVMRSCHNHASTLSPLLKIGFGEAKRHVGDVAVFWFLHKVYQMQ